MSLISKTNKIKVLRQIKANIECKICFDPIIGHVWQCKHGHIICTDCKIRCKLCPYCKDHIDARNRILEEVFEHFVVRCSHNRCNFKSTIAEMKKHSIVCKYKPINCFLCGHLINRDTNSLLKHFTTCHKCPMLKADQVLLVKLAFDTIHFDKPLVWTPKILTVDEEYFVFFVETSKNDYLISIIHLNEPGIETSNTIKLSTTSNDTLNYCSITNIPNIEIFKKHKNVHLTINKFMSKIIDSKHYLTIRLEFVKP